MKTNDMNPYNWQYLRLFFALLVVLIGSSTASHGQGTNTVLVANFMNGNDAALNSRVYLWNPSASAGAVTVRVFTLPLRGGTAQELTTTPLDLGILGAKSALNIKLAEDILTPLGITPPYTTDGGNLTVEFMIQTPDVRGAAQVFSSDFAFGTYPLQVVPPPDEVSFTVETGICIVERFSWGDIISVSPHTSGSVSGPVGTVFSAAGLSDLSCSAWSNCERTGAEPSTTGWTYSGYGIRGLNTMYYYAGTESFSTTVTCPTN